MMRLHALNQVIGMLVQVSSVRPSEEAKLFLMDSKPIPVCHPLRHVGVRVMREDDAWFGKTSKRLFLDSNFTRSLIIWD
jgi:hypothetical protein